MAVLGLRVPMSINCVVYRYTEDFMADLAFQSMSLWYTLEAEAGTSLREMGAGGMSDTTDDMCGSWNWRKVCGIGKSSSVLTDQACAETDHDCA